ncbi:MAG TPA: hypothetical protein VGQ36_12395 [Thermoanaerobaculia bacterium]|nr:hypothetical protein [Thermoanaerobaculia bacterium]
MARSQNTFVKRQREQQKREKAAAKAEKRAQRKTEKALGGPNDDDSDIIADEPEDDLTASSQ